MNKFLLFVALLMLATIVSLRAQTTEGGRKEYLTLQQCVDIAMGKNLTIKLAENQVAQAELDLLQSKLNYLPSVNGSIGFNRTFGATFDQVTFSRIQAATTISTPSLTAQLPLFAGLTRYYVLQQNKFALEANKNALENQKNTVIIAVIRTFLQVIFDQTQVDIVNYRIKTLQGQLDRANRLYNAGSGILFDVLNIQSQIAVENNNLITAQNTLNTDRVTLFQLLQLNTEGTYEQQYEIQRFDTTGLTARIVADAPPALPEIEKNALEGFPSIKQQRFNIMSLRYTRKNLWGAYLPTVSLQGFLGSNFTTNAPTTLPDPSTSTLVPFQLLDASGILNPVPLGFTLQPGRRPNRTDYFGQLSDNFNYGFGINMVIPIFRGWSISRQARGAWINLNNAEIQLEQNKNQLISDVRRAVLDLNASKARLQNITSQQAAQDENFVNAEARFNGGLINFVQYLEVLNNRTSLQQQKIQSVYEYVLRRKIVDFYNGKPLTFNEK